MKIYLAGMIQTGFVYRGNSQSENVLITDKIRREYPNDLESYHYIGKNRHAPEYLRSIPKTIFLDSGAFSMFTQGIDISLEDYAEYINANQDWIHVASNIDAIGRGQEQKSYDNQRALEKMMKGPTAKPGYLCPVHHARDDDKWLQRYIAEGYPYIFLGGMVPESTKYLYGWLDHVWDKYLTNKDGTAKIKVHGFGLTTLELIERYPWYSVDSITWVILGRYGFIYIDMPNGMNKKLIISDQSPAVHGIDKHYDNLSPPVKNAVRQRCEDLGYDVELLRTHYGWRDHFNIAMFGRFQARLNPVFKRRQVTILGY